MPAMNMRLSESMQRDWDERARKDAFHYIASWRKDWDAESFFESGEQDYRKFVEPVLMQRGFQPQGKTMLEVGCGVGRMTRSFARRFGSVCAFDISSEMQRQGQSYLRDVSNVCWVLGDGATLSAVGSRTVDFVFSYLVLQHLPTRSLVRHLVGEMLRVVKEGGVFLFQFDGSRRPTMNWKGRLTWGCVDALWALRMKRASRFAASLLRLDPTIAGKSWRGASVAASEVVEVARAAGGSRIELARHGGLAGDGTPMTWCSGVKLAETGS